MRTLLSPAISHFHRSPCLWQALLALLLLPTPGQADGKVVGPRLYRGRPYAGSLEERAQEAIVIFQGSDTIGKATEDLILKVRVAGEVDRFAWVIPFPNKPKAFREDGKLFAEIYDYVEAQLVRRKGHVVGSIAMQKSKDGAGAKPKPVEVLSREVVGTYDVAVVRENVAGNLNKWLKGEGYQPLPGAEDVIGFYRKKGYVFACVKVADVPLAKRKEVDLHPLRFTFHTGGRDGIYFPMKMTGLQTKPFDVNLYVFYRFWINDRVSKFGYVHRGFQLRYRDWDSSESEPDAGKAYSSPREDPFLRPLAGRILTVARLFQKLHPGDNYYLTNIQAYGLRPQEVRQWSDDLWLFPYYTKEGRVPYDVRQGGPASAAWPHEAAPDDDREEADGLDAWPWVAAGGAGLAALLLGLWAFRRRSPEH
jgi:hypothetical protein